jgi:hypothetical protein
MKSLLESLSKTVILTLFFSSAALASIDNKDEYCAEYVSWLFSHVSKQNQQESHDRALVKFILNYNELMKISHSLSSTDNNILTQMGERFKRQYPKYAELIQSNQHIYMGPFLPYYWHKRPFVYGAFDLGGALSSIKSIKQSYSPQMNKHASYMEISDWDIFNANNLSVFDKSVKRDKLELSGPTSLKGKAMNLDKNLDKSVSNIIKDNAKSFQKQCPDYKFEDFANQNKITCDAEVMKKDLFDFKLADLTTIIRDPAFQKLLDKTPNSLPPVYVEKLFKTRDEMVENSNEKYGAYYCKRPPNILTTIILHHTAGWPQTPAMYEHKIHINRWKSIPKFKKYKDMAPEDIPEDIKKEIGEAAFYMFGYHYSVSGIGEATLNGGRPIWMKGSHAGATATIEDPQEYEHVDLPKGLWCGKDEQHRYHEKMIANKVPRSQWDMSKMPTLQEDQMFIDGKLGANATSIGVSFSGDFRKSSKVPVPKKKVLEKGIDNTAKLICELQNEHPTIKTLAVHRQYGMYCNSKTGKITVRTSCPGWIMPTVFQKILERAKEYGCEFRVNPMKPGADCD